MFKTFKEIKEGTEIMRQENSIMEGKKRTVTLERKMHKTENVVTGVKIQ